MYKRQALAAHFGLPFCFAHFINPDGGDGVTRAYRAHFRPSALHAQPMPLMAMGVLCADTDEEADLLAKSRDVWAMRLRTSGNPGPIPSVEEALAAASDPRVDSFLASMRRRSLVGSPRTVRAGLEPLVLSFKEGLALNNGTGQMLASAILAIGRMQAAVKLADINAAVALEAFCGRSAAFDERVHALRPHPGQIAAAANIRRLVDGSGLVDIPYHRVPRFHAWSPSAWPDDDTAARTFDLRWDYVPKSERGARSRFYQRNLPFRGGKKIQPQDAYSLRCMPQVHGAVKDSLERVREIARIELNSVTDNPLVFADAEAGQDHVVSAGNFHGMPIALALTQLKCCIPVLAAISERRLNKLLDPATNDGLPPFLIGNEDGTDSGHMIVQYTAAALVNELATRAHPATVYSIPTSANAEDHVSMGATEGRHVLEMLDDLERTLALEMLVATQALEFRLQILSATYTLATNLGVQALRSKLRNLSPVNPGDETMLLAEDVKRLQVDLKQLKGIAPAAPSRAVVELVREHGIAFLARDRNLGPDIEKAIGLVQSGAVVARVEALLGSPLE